MRKIPIALFRHRDTEAHGDSHLCADPEGGVGKSALSRLIAREYANAGWNIKIADLDVGQGARASTGRAGRLPNELQPIIPVERFWTVDQALKFTVAVDLLILDAPPNSIRIETSLKKSGNTVWLGECQTIAFENHHDRICKRRDGGCGQLGRERYGAGASLLSRLIGQGALTEPLRRLFLDKKKLHPEAERAWGCIVRSFCRVETNGHLTHKDDAASPIVTAMLDRYGTRRNIKQLGSLFRNSKELELTLRHRVAKAFGIPVENVTDSEDES